MMSLPSRVVISLTFLMHELTETATPELLPNNNLRDVCNNDFRLAVVKSNFSRHSHRFALVLLRIREVPGAGGWNKGGDDLIRVRAAQVQENVASPGLVNAVNLVRHRCYLANVFCRFRSRACDWTLGDHQSGNPGEKQHEENFGFHSVATIGKSASKCRE